MSKKKLLYLIPVAIFFFAAGVSLLLANSGHFKLLADSLNIKADVSPAQASCDTLTATGATTDAFNGTYIKSGTVNGQSSYTNGKIWLCWAPYGTVRQSSPSWTLFGNGQDSQRCQNGVAINSAVVSSFTNTVLPANPWQFFYDGGGGGNVPVFSCGGGGEDPVTDDIFSVEGIVKDGLDGAPIIGAKVSIGGKEASTDNRGFFEIRGISYVNDMPSSYQLSVSSANYDTLNPYNGLRAYWQSRIRAGELISIETIYLTRPFTLRGQVLDSENKPMEGVSVKVSCLDPSDCSTFDARTRPAPVASTGTFSSFVSSTGATVQYNYEIKDIFNPDQFGSKVNSYKVEFTKDGYRADYRLNNTETSPWLTINPPSTMPIISKADHTKIQTYIYRDGNEKKDLALQDVRMNLVGVSGLETFDLVGKITDKENNRILSEVTVNIFNPTIVNNPIKSSKSLNVYLFDQESRSDIIATIPDVQYNYRVSGIYNIAKTNSSPSSLKVEYTRNGYKPVTVIINKSDIGILSNMAIARKDVAMESTCIK